MDIKLLGEILSNLREGRKGMETLSKWVEDIGNAVIDLEKRIERLEEGTNDVHR